MMSTWSYCHKPLPSTLSAECFSYTSRLKWCLQELLPQTSAQYAIYRMFLLHIQAEMVPMANISHKTMPRSLWDVSLTHPGSNGADGELSQTHAHYSIYWMFLLHIQAEIVHTLNHSRKPCPVCSLRACFSFTFMLNWCLQKPLPRTHTQYVL